MHKNTNPALFIIFSILFFVLATSNNSILVLTSFILILSRGVQLFLTSWIDSDKLRSLRMIEPAAEKKLPFSLPVLLISLLIEVLPAVIILADFYLLSRKKDVIMNFF